MGAGSGQALCAFARLPESRPERLNRFHGRQAMFEDSTFESNGRIHTRSRFWMVATLI
jgi:hypothetical protein